MSAVTPKSEVQAMFKGTRILLPDIPSTLPGWRVTEREDCSPYVKEAINSWAKRFVARPYCLTTPSCVYTTSNSPYSISQDDAFLKETAAAKFGLVAQFLYPDGDEEALATIACFYAWVCRSSVNPSPDTLNLELLMLIDSRCGHGMTSLIPNLKVLIACKSGKRQLSILNIYLPTHRGLNRPLSLPLTLPSPGLQVMSRIRCVKVLPYARTVC